MTADTKTEPAAEAAIATLRRDGFVMFRQLFTREQAERAHAEIEGWYRRDLDERREKAIKDPHHTGVAGHTVLTAPSHLMLDVYAKSPTLDRMYETMLTDPLCARVLRALAGERFKLRGYNVRRMTGAYDPPPAHEWHRDSPGEIGFGILLNDVPAGEHGATALVPGSHRFPYDPRWNTLFSPPFPGLPIFLKLNPASRLLARQALRYATGASGACGDAYIFINDVWHGRQPNLHGRKSMVVLIGAYPTDFSFPDKVAMPPAETIARLPPRLAEAVRQDQPINEDKNTILHELLRERAPARLPSLFRLAQLERQTAERLSRALAFVPALGRLPRRAARAAYQLIRKPAR